MLLFEILRKDKLQRFFLTLRQEGLKNALSKTKRYLSARLGGHGLTGLLRNTTATGATPDQYLSATWLELAQHNAFHVVQTPAVAARKRKIAMIGDLNLPQCRKYRVEQLEEIWQLNDVEYVYSHYEDVERCVHSLQDATHVMFYRLAVTPLTSMLTYEARRLGLQILYDLDDPLFSVSAYGTYKNMQALPDWQKQHFINQAPSYLDVMNGSDLISVSTPGMVEHTKLYSQRPVFMRRNFADQISLTSGKHAMENNPRSGGEKFRVGFASGSQGHEVDFAEIQNDVITFLDGAKNRELVILGHFKKSLLPTELQDRVEEHPFASYEDYLKNLASVDVAVMPLADDLFNRCKSGVRVIDAASVGVPSIVGTVSDMAALVDHEQSGFVVPQGNSWLTALNEIATTSGLADAMGQAARASLETTWAARSDHPVIDTDVIQWVKK